MCWTTALHCSWYLAIVASISRLTYRHSIHIVIMPWPLLLSAESKMVLPLRASIKTASSPSFALSLIPLNDRPVPLLPIIKPCKTHTSLQALYMLTFHSGISRHFALCSKFRRDTLSNLSLILPSPGLFEQKSECLFIHLYLIHLLREVWSLRKR